MLRVSLAFTALLGFAIHAIAAPPSPDPKSLKVPPEELSKARELVKKLGSENFTEREEAERNLESMGRTARIALIDGVNLDPDAEVRARCRSLLPKATALEMKARLDSFLADKDGKYEHELPGWRKLRSVTRGEWSMLGWSFSTQLGTDNAARELFVEFLNAPGGAQLLTALGGPKSDLNQLVAYRKHELYNMRFGRVIGVPARTPTMMEVAVVMLADSFSNSKVAPRNINFQSVLTTSGITNAVRGSDERSKAMNAILTAWFDTRTDLVEMNAALAFATSVGNNDSAGRIAGRMMTTVGGQSYYKGQALATLVRLKMVDQLPAIEKALSDTTALSTTIKIVDGKQVRKTIEVRDAALAAALLLTEQDPDDYGFEAFPKNGTFSYAYARLEDEKRSAAFMKYGWWKLKASMKAAEGK